MKKEIYISLLLLVLLIPIALFIYLKLNSKEEIIGEIVENTITTYPIEGIQDAKQILWKDSENILVTNNNTLFSHNIESRATEQLLTIDLNTTIGIYNNEIILCTWENATIYSPEEFASTISIYNLESTKFWEAKFHETVKVETCNLEEILAKTSFEFMQQKYYIVGIEDKSISETEYIKEEHTLLEGIVTTPIQISEFNENTLGVIDNLGTVWIQLLKN